MDEETKSGYVTGIASLIGAAIFIIFTFQLGLKDMSGQIMGVLGLVFAILGVGSLWKPKFIGPIAAQILENLAKNTEEQGKKTYKQTQHHSKNSPQGYTEKGDVHLTQNFYEEKSKK